MQENYKILGLEEGATAEQVREAYERLRARYAEDRFLDGERGNEAAKNLTLVESAYPARTRRTRNSIIPPWKSA